MLDAGVDGVIVPAVESAAQAGQLVRAACFPPRGRRSQGLARASLLGPRDQPLLLPMVETRAGLDHLDEPAVILTGRWRAAGTEHLVPG